MSLAELIWFAAQINNQKWRFYYGRMASQNRLKALEVDPPPDNLPVMTGLVERLRSFQGGLDDLYDIDRGDSTRDKFVRLASLWKSGREPHYSAAVMARHPAHRQIIAMGQDAVPLILETMDTQPDHWFLTLHEITKEDPVQEQHRGNVHKMTSDWIKWGRSRGLINNGD